MPVIVLYWKRPGQEYAEIMAKECFDGKLSSHLVIELPANYTLKDAKRLVKDMKKKDRKLKGTLPLMSACYVPSSICSDKCDLDCHELNTIYVGVPKSNPKLSEYITVRSFEELGEDIRVVEEESKKHIGKLSMRVTIFPEFRAPCGKIFMNKQKTRDYLLELSWMFQDYIEGDRLW